MTPLSVKIFDHSSRQLVEAELHDELPASRLVEVEVEWGIERLTGYQRRPGWARSCSGAKGGLAAAAGILTLSCTRAGGFAAARRA